jgi:hypothetical protein
VRDGFFPPCFDFFGFWPEGLRGFMNWIVALQCSAWSAFLIAH